MRIIILLFLVISINVADINIGEIPQACTIKEEDGGYISGGDFNTNVLKNKIHVLIYADPDEQEKGKALNKALDDLAQTLPLKLFKKYLVINMDDTWKPNFIIEKMLVSHQGRHPDSIFVKDKSSVLSQAWGLEHDAYICMVFNEKGRLIYKKSGEFSQYEITEIVSLIKKETGRIR